MEHKLRKPENWTDFESLCKKLWGEIWQCPEIKKNGRQGQNQSGVDIYGIPKYEDAYYGIQCKGKDDYTNSQLTINEIEDEIKKATTFCPALKKYYIATTANKDAKIETYFRQKNLENIVNGLFEVHLFCWEDIVPLIDENKHTHDWYLKGIGFKSKHSIKLTFENNSEIMLITPEYLSVQSQYVFDKDYRKDMPSLFNLLSNKIRVNTNKTIYEDRKERWLNPQPISFDQGLNSIYNTLYNKSCSKFKLKITNDGGEMIEDYKITFTLEGVYLAIEAQDMRDNFFDFDGLNYKHTSFFDTKENKGICIPKHNSLVPQDDYVFDNFCIKAVPTDQTITLKWNLISRSYSTEGTLTINSKPILINKTTIHKTSLSDYSGKEVHFYKNHYVEEKEFYNR
jgi:hypothetical protein